MTLNFYAAVEQTYPHKARKIIKNIQKIRKISQVGKFVDDIISLAVLKLQTR
jgi:uncharacterized protein (UPF0128 family)